MIPSVNISAPSGLSCCSLKRKPSIASVQLKQLSDKENEAPNKVKRKIHSYRRNETASIELKTGNSVTDEDHQAHAYNRMQLIYNLAKKVFQTAMRSTGAPGNVNVYMGHASGQGGSCKVPGYHAAHDSPFAGFQEDRCFHIMQEIVKDKEMTPHKRTVLKNAGMPEDMLQFVETNASNLAAVASVFYMYLPYLKVLSPQDMIAQDTTTPLQERANTIVDRRMERIVRKTACLVFVSCMQGLITPEILCIKTRDMILNHFGQALVDLSDRRLQLAIYRTAVETCLDLEEKWLINKGLDSKDLAEYEKNLAILKSTKDNLLSYRPGAPVPYKIKECHYFDEPLELKIKKIDMMTLVELPLLPAIEEADQLYKNLYHWTESQYRGTKLPPFEYLTINKSVSR